MTTKTLLSGFRKAGIILTRTEIESDNSHTEEEVVHCLPPELAELLRSGWMKNWMGLVIWSEIESLVNLLFYVVYAEYGNC